MGGLYFPSGCTSSLQSSSVSILHVSQVEPARSMPNFLVAFPGSISYWNIYTPPLICLLLLFPCYLVPVHQFPSAFTHFSSMLEAHCSHTSLTGRILLLQTAAYRSSAFFCCKTKFSSIHHYPWSLGGHPDSLAEFSVRAPIEQMSIWGEGKGVGVWFCSQWNWQTLPYR